MYQGTKAIVVLTSALSITCALTQMLKHGAKEKKVRTYNCFKVIVNHKNFHEESFIKVQLRLSISATVFSIEKQPYKG